MGINIIIVNHQNTDTHITTSLNWSIMKLTVIFSLLILTTCITSCQNLSSSRSIASNGTPVFVHGLDEVNISFLRSWSQGLYSTQGVPPTEKVKDMVMRTYYKSSNISVLINNLMDLKLHQKYISATKYKELAEGLFAARKEIRKDLAKNNKKTRQAMLLLEMLAEETLYIREVIFKDHKMIAFNYSQGNIKTVCKNRISSLNKIPICQGDIILSKGGAGSSSFLARITDYPGNFSHSTISYIAKNSKKLTFIEAFIEDGVKLRTPDNDYIKSKKAKLFVYRSKSTDIIRKGIRGVDKFITKMKNRVNTNNLDTLKVTASFPYDFAMDAADDSKLFCSEVVYHAYKSTVSDRENPYTKKNWGAVTDPSRKLFLSKFLDSHTTFPSPSDVELNSELQLIAMQFNPQKLSADRIIVALTDAIMKILIENRAYLAHYIEQLGPLGTEIVDPVILKEKILLISKLLNFKITPETLTAIEQVPENINYKQLVFFAYLDQKLAPKMVKEMQGYEKQLHSQGKILDLITMREVIYPAVEKEIKKFIQQVNQFK